jgi:hypothetical protein
VPVICYFSVLFEAPGLGFPKVSFLRFFTFIKRFSIINWLTLVSLYIEISLEDAPVMLDQDVIQFLIMANNMNCDKLISILLSK